MLDVCGIERSASPVGEAGEANNHSQFAVGPKVAYRLKLDGLPAGRWPAALVRRGLAAAAGRELTAAAGRGVTITADPDLDVRSVTSQ